jgi:hypothetical protein
MTTDERLYGEEEVAEIFEAAASARGSGGRALASPGGLSLRELQEIGGEVGIAPERIADAAAALELRREAPPSRTHLGMPMSVRRTVDLPRAPTDREWGLLLAELRAWTNGNLHAYVEPTDAGHRLRLGTLKGDAVAMGRMGISGLLGGLVIFLALLLTGDMEEAIASGVFFATLGAVLLALNALRLPGWAREREEQMEYIAVRARALIRPESEGADAGQHGAP